VTGKTDLTISVVNLNTRETLEQCLLAIKRGAGNLILQTIVVDNGSTDGSADMVASRFPAAELVRNSTNRYFSAAHNQAFAQAVGRYVLILNSDVIVEADCLPNLISFMDLNPRVGAATCLLRLMDGSRQRSAWRLPRLRTPLLGHRLALWLLPHSQSRDEYNMADWDGLTTREVEVGIDAMLCVRREALRQVGGYDEKLLLYYTEQDLCLRLRTAGWQIWFFAGATANHLTENTSRRMNPWWIWWVRRRDMVAYFRKHNGLLPALLLNVIFTIDVLIRVPVKSLARAISTRRSQ
jgi:GT2 family glycosyltransferase